VLTSLTSITGPTTIEEAFSWPKYYFDQLNRTFHDKKDGGPLHDKTAEEAMRDAMNEKTVSCAYGGIDAPGTSLSMMAAHLSHHFGIDIKEPRCVYNVEIDEHCQTELLQHPSRCQCCFGDLNQFWREPIKTDLAKLIAQKKTISLESLLPLIHSGVATTTTGGCLVHGRHCPMTRSSCHVAGPTCTPYAPNGKQGGTNDSECMVPYAAWASTCLQLGHDVIICENSDRFPEDIMKRTFGGTYGVQSMVLNGVDYGWPGRRKRFFGVGMHLSYVNQAVTRMKNVIPLFFRMLRMTYHNFLLAEQEPLLQVCI
jgi:hypothetical protein